MVLHGSTTHTPCVAAHLSYKSVLYTLHLVLLVNTRAQLDQRHVKIAQLDLLPLQGRVNVHALRVRSSSMVLVSHVVLGDMLRLEHPVRIVLLANRQTVRQDKILVQVALLENILNLLALQAVVAV